MVEIIENQLSLTCNSLKDLPDIASQIIDFAGVKSVIAFEGQLGAGKTTLIKNICRNIGVKDNISSPSFSIINEYLDANGDAVYHFDFYRINDVEEALDIGTVDYFYSDCFCLIEWPLKVIDLIPENHIFVVIEVTGNESRIFHIKKHDG